LSTTDPTATNLRIVPAICFAESGSCRRKFILQVWLLMVGFLCLTDFSAWARLPDVKPPTPLTEEQKLAQAQLFRRVVVEMVQFTQRDGFQQVGEQLRQGVWGLYQGMGVTPSARVVARLPDLRPGDPEKVLEEVYQELQSRPKMTLGRGIALVMNHLKSQSDPQSGLVFQDHWITAPAALAMGFELEGFTAFERIVYQMDLFNLDGLRIGTPPRSPLGPIWSISRVVPGSAAAEAGLEPADQILALDGEPITQDKVDELFFRLIEANMPLPRNADFLDGPPKPLQLTIRSGATKRDRMILYQRSSRPAPSYFPPKYNSLGEPEFLLDEAAKIAVIRVGAVELDSEWDFVSILNELRELPIRGLILDLRWCPGGYVTPTNQLLSQFLPAGTEISRLQTISSTPFQNDLNVQRSFGPNHPEFLRWPLAVLVNAETTGGGEMIAAALQDHRRARIYGQRTFGKANIMTATPTMFAGIAYRMTTGYSIRPNGTMRHRFPTSRRDEPWGVRPDRGLEIPTTPDWSQIYRDQSEALALRRPGDRRALPADAWKEDAQRYACLQDFKHWLETQRASNQP